MGELTSSGIKIQVIVLINNNVTEHILYLKPSRSIDPWIKGSFVWKGEVAGIKVEFEQKGKDHDPLPSDIEVDERINIDKHHLVELINDYVNRETD